MSSGEFKARALYDFVAEGPNELSFNTNEILTITSNTAGNGWWYAKNSVGKVGVIPQNYVESLMDLPEPNEPPPPISTFSTTYPNRDSVGGININNNSLQRTSLSLGNPPPYEQPQYVNPTPTNNWPPMDTAWSSSAPSNVSRPSRGKDSDSDDSWDEPDDPPIAQHHTLSNTPSRQNSLKSSTTLASHSTSPFSGNRPSMPGGETSKGPPRARFFDKHGLDNYLLNGSKTKPEEHVEITYDDAKGGVCWELHSTFRPFHCKVEDPSKGTKLGGLKAFMEYKIHTDIPGSRVVLRRYKQFDWLHEQLVNKFRFICIPPLPEKQIAGRFDQDFVEERRRQLELWLNRICRHPVLCASFAVQHFITCEVNDKSRKDWKSGKRRVEKDESREASWLQCVEVANTRLSESQIASQIETFAQQQPGLESQLKNLQQGLSRYLERQTGVYERDILKVSEFFTRVHGAVQVDNTTAGNRDLSNSIQKISSSYSEVAGLYREKATEGLKDLIERIQEYIGILACFPSILSLQRSGADFIKSIQQRGSAADFTNTIHRGLVLNHVVLAEINFFQQEKVADLKMYLKDFVAEQIDFYDKVTGSLRDASLTFK